MTTTVSTTKTKTCCATPPGQNFKEKILLLKNLLHRLIMKQEGGGLFTHTVRANGADQVTVGDNFTLTDAAVVYGPRERLFAPLLDKLREQIRPVVTASRHR